VSLIKAYWVILRIHFQEIHSQKSKAVFPHRVFSSSVKNMEQISPVGTEKTQPLERGDHLRSFYLNICQVLDVKESFSILDEDEIIGLVTASNLKIAFGSMGYQSSMMTDDFSERIVDENEYFFEHHLILNKKQSKKLAIKCI